METESEKSLLGKRPIEDDEEEQPSTVKGPTVPPHLLKLYYQKLFPFKEMWQWLSYEDDDYFSRREFSFTIDDDIYIRYRSFQSPAEFEKDVIAKSPNKIDIGAVFTAPPREHATVKADSFKPVSKELVFDIDISDYDDARRCCSGSEICEKCWPYMATAIKVLNSVLRVEFGFQHLLFVFSGRRGVHCWVCDPHVRAFSNEVRSAVSDFIQVYKGGDQMKRKVDISTPLHPTLVRLETEFLEEQFVKTVVGAQEMLSSPEGLERVLSVLGDEELTKAALAELQISERADPRKKWEGLKGWLGNRQKSKKSSPRPFTSEIVFSFLFPRLDINVSKQLHHLLKSPFVVHPGTGKVCVPIDPKEVDEFNPDQVPTVAVLTQELEEMASQPDDTRTTVARTSLGRHIDFFVGSFLTPMLEDVRQQRSTKIKADKDLREAQDFMSIS